jgi:hypothetical protein
VYAYYAATQGWDKATIKSQIIDVYNSSDLSNFSALDVTSIMMCVCGTVRSQGVPLTLIVQVFHARRHESRTHRCPSE